jgi:hypothetical protein
MLGLCNKTLAKNKMLVNKNRRKITFIEYCVSQLSIAVTKKNLRKTTMREERVIITHGFRDFSP